MRVYKRLVDDVHGEWVYENIVMDYAVKLDGSSKMVGIPYGTPWTDMNYYLREQSIATNNTELYNWATQHPGTDFRRPSNYLTAVFYGVSSARTTKACLFYDYHEDSSSVQNHWIITGTILANSQQLTKSPVTGEWYGSPYRNGQCSGSNVQIRTGNIVTLEPTYNFRMTFHRDFFPSALSFQNYFNTVFTLAIDRGVRFPRFFHDRTAAEAWLSGVDEWSEEDIDVNTQWTKPRSNLNIIHAYKMTADKQSAFQRLLWIMDGNNEKVSHNLYSNPMEAIIGFLQIPFALPSDNVGNNTDILVGTVVIHQAGGGTLKAPEITDEFAEYSFGSKTISRIFNDYRDFTEVSIQLYLPCIGWKSLDAQTYMGKELIIKYRVNFTTGDVIALLITNPGNIIQDTVSGNCGQSIPISGKDFTNLLQAKLAKEGAKMNAVAGFASGAITAGAGAVTVGAGIASTNPAIIGHGVAGIAGGAVSMGSSIANGVQGSRNADVNVTKAQNQVVKDGSIGGSTGMLNYPNAYILISHHADAMPQRYQNYEGYQANKLLTVTNLTGYIRAREVYFSSARATEQEKAMVEKLLKGGVFK